jgi:hypothetical protein
MLRKNVPLNDWYLVVPAKAIDALNRDAKLALTQGELRRIEAWRNEPGRVIAWKGLNFYEKSAADSPPSWTTISSEDASASRMRWQRWQASSRGTTNYGTQTQTRRLRRPIGA